MEGVTLTIAIAASALVLFISPVYGLIIYIASLAWYPSYLSVKLGSIDFTVTRIVIMAIFVNLFFQTKLLNKFKLIWLDKLVIIYYICQMLAGIMTTPISILLENRAGAAFDTALPYFAVRIIITTKERYLVLLKGILVIAAPLAIIGFYQCLTGNNPFGFLRNYHAWKGGGAKIPISRYGFFRAEATFPMSIMYGLFFAMFGPVCAGIVKCVKKHKTLIWLGLGLMGLGVFSSMSSGPMLAAIVAILFVVFYQWRRYWKSVTVFIIIMCGFVELASDRHFYDVLGGLTINPSTAWYRSKLIDVALFEGGMSGHWLVGYGEVDPGWGRRIDGYKTDIVNHYIFILSRFGLAGLLPFLGLVTAAIKNLIEAYRVSLLDLDRWLIWCLFGALFGTLLSLFSVSLFGQPITVFYFILGFCGVMPLITTSHGKLLYSVYL